jgi:endonuclease III related protein
MAQRDRAPGRLLREAYRILRTRNGNLHWWPGRTPLEVIVGAILTQNTAWANVEKAIAALRAERLLSLRGLRGADRSRLERAIRPSGYFRQKTRKIAAFLDMLDREYGGSLARMGRAATPDLRARLLATWGIGPETADSILLYAFGRPVFVVDAYTRRVAARHGWAPARADYPALQRLFTGALPQRVALYNDCHAQLVWVGKHFCRPRPRCEICPLRQLLPAQDARARSSSTSAGASAAR